jgi:hypothetical protein
MMNFFKRLFGKKEKVALELPLEFLQADPPDWLLELKVTFLPRGGAFTVRTALQAEAKAGNAAFEIEPPAGKGAAQTASMDLTQIEAGRLLVLLGFSFPDDITDVGSPVIDGVPAKLSVHRREPYHLQEGNCNLMNWLDSKKSQPPTVEIAMLLLDVKNRVFPDK